MFRVATVGVALGVIADAGGSATPSNVAYVLGAALAAALSGGFVAWRRLQVLGRAEREKLEAEKRDIIETAEDRATKRSLEALTLALANSDNERSYLNEQLAAARTEIDALTTRVMSLEALLERRAKPRA